jgi:hypothetical protein
LSFLPRIKYGVNSNRNPDFVLLALDSRFHGNDRKRETAKFPFKELNCYEVTKLSKI